MSSEPPQTSPEAGVDVWDVVVVGGGPAGSSAARAAAVGGARVLLLEKASLPRYKTCGGGLIGTSLASLPPETAAPLVDEVRRITFTRDGRWAATRGVSTCSRPLFGLTRRAELDQRLVTAAQSAGVEVRTGVTVREVRPGREIVELRCGGGKVFTARGVVGADGSASRIAGYVGVRCEQVDLGLEAEIPVPPGIAERWAGRVALDWGAIPGSYGWVFPKGDSLSVGVIAGREHKAAVRSYFRRFVDRLGLSRYKPTISSGHLTRCRTPDSPLRRGRVLVAGDAAGLLEPWTREGISFALRSGRLAGEHAALIARERSNESAASFGDRYGALIADGIGEEMRVGSNLLSLFAKSPWLFHASVTALPPAWSSFVRFMRGEASFVEITEENAVTRAVVRRAGASTAASMPPLVVGNRPPGRLRRQGRPSEAG